MKAADLDEIFGSGTTVPEAAKIAVTEAKDVPEEGGGDEPIQEEEETAPAGGDLVPDDSSTNGAVVAPEAAAAAAANTSVFSAFEQEDAPEEKSRADVFSEGIDRRPLLSVAEIRAKFNKSGARPVFPHDQARANISPIAKGGRSPAAVEASPSSSPRPEALEAAGVPASAKAGDEGAAAAAPAKSAPAKGASAKLSALEFEQVAEVQNCTDSVKLFSVPQKVDIFIQPEASDEILSKQMELQFRASERLLVMIRKGATRYIRLNDVCKIDASADCAAGFSGRNGLPVHPKDVPHTLAMHFTTAKFPMVIALESLYLRNALFRLVVLLRQMLRSNVPLEIVAPP